MSKKIPISALILTFNEEINIKNCLQALHQVDDIVVLDSFSTDNTCAIAKDMGAKVFQHPFDNFANQRNYALDNIAFQEEWVLHLDADEIVTPSLMQEMQKTQINPRFDAYFIPSKMMFMGKWLRYSGMYPSYQVRFGNRHLRFTQVGHGQRENLPLNQLGTLENPYQHFCFSKGITEWVDKHNRYSSDEAKKALEASLTVDWWGLFSLSNRTRRRRALKTLSIKMPFRPLLRFFYMYFIRLGIFDGKPGLHYCLLIAYYEYLIVLKMSNAT